MIVRAYETFNKRSLIRITVPEGFKRAYVCDLLENETQELELCDSTVSLPVKNFEIITLKFER